MGLKRRSRRNPESGSTACEMDYPLLGIVPPGKRNQPKFFFYYADQNPEIKICHEISVKSLFQYLINGNSDPFIEKKLVVPSLLQIIDHKSQIIQVETHRQRPIHSIGLTDIFIVFQTKSEEDRDVWWWSLDKCMDHIIVQRSHDKDAVKNNFKRERREGMEIIAEQLEGKGCIQEFFTLLWIHMIIDIKFQRNLSRCESIIPLIMKKFTKKRYEYDKSDFKYSALSAEEKNPDLRDIIDFLSNVSNWHPLVIAIYLGEIELFDQVQQDGKYNVNGIYNKFTLINLAILFSKIEMIQHLLEKMRVDPLKQDKMGRNALHMAAKFNRETEIINLLLLNRKIPIDQYDANGTTALNYAIMASNTNIVQCLLDNGADPKRWDQHNRSPLHVAAFYTRETKIIDLLLENKGKVDVNECNKFGLTALHYAAKTSNHTTVRHLMKRGANVNCRDKLGLTPLHLAAFFTKDMDMINMFLNNKKVDLHCCDELGQNVVAYAKKNIYGLRQQIIDRLNEKDGGIIKEYNLLKQAKFNMPDISVWKRLIWNPENKPKLFFIPCADLKPGKGWNVSQSALIRYIANEESIEQICSAQSEVFESLNDLRDIDPCSEIEQVEIYQSNVVLMLDGTTLSHYFMIFKTFSREDGDYWWSLEKNVDFIVLQRSRDKETFFSKLNGKERRIVTPTNNNLIGMRGTIKNLFAVLWAYQIIQEKYPKKMSDCQSFVHFVSKRITEIGYESHLFTKENDVKIDFINSLSLRISKWHPLFLAICLGNTKLFDKIEEMATFDHSKNELTPLNLAIALPNKTETVQHLLEGKKADPTLRDGLGRNALEMAAIHADNTKIIDLILAHQNEKVNIDWCDESGWTALHFAVASSNVVATRRLIERGAKPNVIDNHGFSPLHLAAYYSDNKDVMEIILKALKEKGVDEAIDIVDDRTSDGNTALHTAVIASNDFTTEYLIKKGANPNIKDKNGRTPLHLAAFNAKDMKMINVLLSSKKIDANSLDNFGRNALHYAKHNQNGLSEETVSRLQEIDVKKNIGDYSTVLLSRFLNFEIGIVWISLASICIFILVLFLAMEKSQKQINGWVMLLTIFIVFFIYFFCAFVYKILRLSLIKCLSKLRDLNIKLLMSIMSSIKKQLKIQFSQNLLYMPNADQQFLENRWNLFNMGHKSSFHEISQDALFQYLLKKDTADFIDILNISDGSSETFDYKMYQMLDYLRDFKKEYHITNLEVYQSDVNWLKSNLLKFHHTFIVFKTTSQSDGCYWWSLDHNPENIAIQRSRNKFAVRNRLMGKDRENIQMVKRKDDEGKGTMFDLLTTLWAHNVFPENDDVKSNRQTFLQFIEKANNQSVVKSIKRQNKQEATCKQKKISLKPIVSYSSPLNKTQSDLLSDLVIKFPKWKPICAIIYLGDHILLENLLGNSGNIPQDTNNLVDNTYVLMYGTTLLRMAILFSRTKMVQILLRNENLNLTFENEVRSDMPWKDMSVFHMAAAFTNDTKIIDLLLKHSKVKTDTNAQGRTALHFVAMKSNETAQDRSCIDDCDSKGRTALHHAAIESNVTIARHLMEKGANPNKRDHDGNTPLALAAKLAKDMKIIDLFLNNEMVCKELQEKGGDQIYNCAIQNKTAGIYNEIENRLRNKNIIPKEDQLTSTTGHSDDAIIKRDENKISENIVSSAWRLNLHFSAHGVVSNMQMHTHNSVLQTGESREMFGPIFGRNFKEKLLFVPNADTNPEVKHEISEPALFRFLLNEKTVEDQAEIPLMLNTLNCIDKLSRITEIEIHQSSMGSLKDLGKAFHVFIVFKSSGKDGDYWWSFEKNLKYIVLQRSHNTNDVKNKLYGKKRNNVKAKAENLAGKGTIKDLFVMVWAYQVIPEKCHIVESNCQSLVTLVSKEITENRYEYKGLVESNPLLRYFYKCLPHKEKRNVEMLDFINILSMSFERKGHPLFHLIYYENPILFDIVMESGEYDINETFTDHRMTTLHQAIVILSPKMVGHLLENWKADPTKPDGRGRTALHLAALYAQDSMEIIDLLLGHKKVDINERDLDHGRTALHYAVCASNKTTAEYLIKKGANINYRDKDGRTPLHLAAAFAQDVKIIELLLANIEKEDVEKQYIYDENIFDYAEKNENGLGKEIIARLRTKGIFGKEKNPAFSNMEDETNKTSDETVASNEKTEKEIEIIIQKKKNEIKFFEIFRETKRIFSNERQKKKLSAETEVAFATQIKIMLPLALATALENIIIESNVERVHDLKDEGKDISKVTWENGENALHVAAKWAKTREMIDVIQENGKFDINGVDSNGYTPLHYALLGTNPTIDHEGAVYNKDIDLFDLFLKPEKVDIDCDKSEKPAQLMNESNLTTTRYLIEKGADPNIAVNGWTPFLLAARFAKDVNIFRLFLVNNMVDVHCINNGGENALTLLCLNYKEENLIDIVRLLIEKNIDVNCKNEDGWSSLHNLCRYYDKENLLDIVRLLIKENIDVNCKIEGWNALHFVCRYYDKENLIDIVRLLIDINIDVNSKTNGGNNALTLLCLNYKEENLIYIVRLLIDNKIDVNCKNNDGWNALHFVCHYPSKSRLVDLVRLLVQHKIDKKVTTTGGEIGTARSFLLKRFKEEEIKDVLQLLDS